MKNLFYLVPLLALYILASIFSIHGNELILLANLTGVAYLGKCIWDAVSGKAKIEAAVAKVEGEVKADIAHDEVKSKIWIDQAAHKLEDKIKDKL